MALEEFRAEEAFLDLDTRAHGAHGPRPIDPAVAYNELTLAVSSRIMLRCHPA